MGAYVMHCTVCTTDYSDIKGWNRHLLGSDHQEKARCEMSQWDKQVRKCALVLYSSFPLVISSAEELLVYISEGMRGIRFIVTDFVLSKSNQKTAILQFESRDKVKEILQTEGRSFNINGQLVQLRKLGNVLELEWLQILESFQVRASFEENPPPVPAGAVQSSSASAVFEMTSVTWPVSVEDDPARHSEHSGTLTNESMLKCAQEVRTQFLSVLQEVEIPDEEFNLIMEVMKKVKALSQEKVPHSQVSLYRNNILKLRNNGKRKRYFVLVHGEQENNTIVSTAIMNNIPFEACFFRTDFSESVLQSLNASKKLWKVCEPQQRFLCHQQLGIEISVLCAEPKQILEVQLSRLVSYYCHFDGRVKVLFALTYYWANTNKIYFRRSNRLNHVALEWLLLFFLFHKEKIVPVPQEILERPHSPFLNKVQGSCDVDVGFDFDMEFAKRWCVQAKKQGAPDDGTMEFFLSVLELLQRFFVFYIEEISELTLLNTRDGELITRNSSFSSSKKNNLIASSFKSAATYEKPVILLIDHPITSTRLTVVSEEKWWGMVRPSMKQTAIQLSLFISSLKNCISSFNHCQGSFSGSLKDVLKLA